MKSEVRAESWMNDFRVTGTMKGQEVDRVQSVKSFCTCLSCGDEVEEIVDGTAADAAVFGIAERVEHLGWGETQHRESWNERIS